MFAIKPKATLASYFQLKYFTNKQERSPTSTPSAKVRHRIACRRHPLFVCQKRYLSLAIAFKSFG
ncbi:MAG: hypothetical protein RM049_03735 [Nostoc sp. DedQUE04]|uniref:hypothetical protein n=1 Tax=Nostoc sp. DedQUE04 TaxID=3075390 RepID=UPI002AD574A2|nr:hypothetical protein [Nostoc sp. DedQUE04]MDZ8134396.1 hypothetical protein [Nostoc sp. DedQUE04]